MNSSKTIRSVSFDNRKKLVSIDIGGKTLSLPYARLSSRPSPKNQIISIEVDRELANQAVTYKRKDGTVDSIPLDAFLDFNKDPEYIRSVEIYKLTIAADNLAKRNGMSKREIARRMGTSLSQVSRLFSATNNRKSLDQMVKLLTVLGADVTVSVA